MLALKIGGRTGFLSEPNAGKRGQASTLKTQMCIAASQPHCIIAYASLSAVTH